MNTVITIILIPFLVIGSVFIGNKLSHTDCVCDCCTEKTVTAEPAKMEEKMEKVEPVEFYTNHNVYGVQNNPTEDTKFDVAKSTKIYSIETYHWNNAKGSAPGQISLLDEDGKVYGPWETTGRDGQGGVKDAYWTAYPDITLQPGTYTIVDSEPETWAHNTQNGNEGMVRVYSL